MWLVIGIVAVLIGVGLNQLIRMINWFWVRRPAWLTFEWAIPIIWTSIFL
jgi:tryptophan-rich sensory protein